MKGGIQSFFLVVDSAPPPPPSPEASVRRMHVLVPAIEIERGELCPVSADGRGRKGPNKTTANVFLLYISISDCDRTVKVNISTLREQDNFVASNGSKVRMLYLKETCSPLSKTIRQINYILLLLFLSTVPYIPPRPKV
jgi:hypothetical protein